MVCILHGDGELLILIVESSQDNGSVPLLMKSDAIVVLSIVI